MRNIILDLDGTFVDSEAVMSEAWNQVNRECAIETPFAEYKKHIGLPFDDILTCMSITCQKQRSQIYEIYNITSKKLANKIAPFPEVLDVIRSIDNKKGIVTSKNRERTDFILKPYKNMFDIIICAGESRRDKPYGDPLVTAAKNLGSDVFYIGDTYIDYLAAKNAGIDYYHAAWGIGDRPVGSDQINSPSDIYEICRCYT